MLALLDLFPPTLHSCQDTDIDQGGEDEEIHTEAL